jgi:hypothetical protein
MAPGSWELRLKKETPAFVRARINAFAVPDYLVVLPTHIPAEDLTWDSVLAASIYTGCILKHTRTDPGKPMPIGGMNLLWLLGDTSRSPDIPRGAFTGVTTFPLVLAYLFFNDARSNGLHYSDVGVPTTAVGFSWDTKESTWSIIERWRKATSPETQFRLRHDGTILFAAYNDADLFVQTPTIVVSSVASPGRRAGLTWAKAESVEWIRDRLGTSTSVRYEDAGGSVTTTTDFNVKSFRAGTSVNLTTVVQSSETSAPGSFAGGRYGPRYETRVTGVEGLQVGVDLNVGDTISVHDPWGFAAADIAALAGGYGSVDVDGTLAPLYSQQITGARWPVQSGMGVYWLTTSAASTGAGAPAQFPDEGSGYLVRDITEWVEFESGGPELALGAMPIRVETPPIFKGREV